MLIVSEEEKIKTNIKVVCWIGTLKYFLIFPENWLWHLMQIVSSGDSYMTCKNYFRSKWKKKKKKKKNKKKQTNKKQTKPHKQTKKKKKTKTKQNKTKKKKTKKKQKLKSFSLPSAESAQRAVKLVNTYSTNLTMKNKTLVNLMWISYLTLSFRTVIPEQTMSIQICIVCYQSRSVLIHSLRKHAYSNILKILQPK